MDECDETIRTDEGVSMITFENVEKNVIIKWRDLTTGLNHLSDHCIYQFYLFNYNRVLHFYYVINGIRRTVVQNSIGKTSNINKILVRQIEGVL